MGEVLVLTDFEVKGNKIDSGGVPCRARLNVPTAQSFRKNKERKVLDVRVKDINEKYSKLYNAVVTAETAEAEQKVRDSIMSEKKKSDEAEQLNKKIIEEDNAIAKITSAAVAKKRFAALKISNESMKNRFGNLGENYGVNVKPKFSPKTSAKALSVPMMYKRVYESIIRNADVYKLKGIVEEENGVVEEEKTVANWRSLFDGIDSRTSEVVVALDSHEEETAPVIENSGKLTEEELSRRILQGKAGDELAEIRRLKDNTKGIASPFNSGLIERERSILQILANSTGVESIANKVIETEPVNNNTEFQDLIEKIVGYKEPVTAEVHDEQERKMQEYYSDPDVSRIIDDLRHKDILYSYNQPEFYDKIQEAERKDNERIAENSKAIDVIDSGDNLSETDSIYGKMVESSAAKYVDEVITRVKENDERMKEMAAAQQEEDLQMIKESAPKQAKIINDQYENAKMAEMIKESASVEAKNIQQELDLQMIRESAPEQAKMLKTLSDYMEKQEQLEKANDEERRMILEGAQEQAKMLQRQSEKAQMSEMIRSSAQVEAKRIQQINDIQMIKESAIEQAKALKSASDSLARKETEIQKEKEALLNGAYEQAQMLQKQEASSQMNQMIEEGSREEARRIVMESKKAMMEEKEQSEAIASQIVHENTSQTKKVPNDREITWIDSRYATLNSLSKALRIHPSQNVNIRKRLGHIYGNAIGSNVLPKVKAA